jgi:hypothetical protein
MVDVSYIALAEKKNPTPLTEDNKLKNDGRGIYQGHEPRRNQSCDMVNEDKTNKCLFYIYGQGTCQEVLHRALAR